MNIAQNANQKGGGRFGQADVPKEMLGKLIGSGGSTLKGIEASTSSKILIDDDDDVFFYAPSQEHFKQADDAINEITGHAIKVSLLTLRCAIALSNKIRLSWSPRKGLELMVGVLCQHLWIPMHLLFPDDFALFL